MAPRVRRAFPKALTLYQSADQDAAIRAIARARGVSACEFVRQVLADHLAARTAAAAAPHAPLGLDGTASTHRARVPFQISRPVGQDAEPDPIPVEGDGPPLAWDFNGAAVQIPSAAAGWVVLRRGANTERARATPIETAPGAPLIIDLWAPRAWLRAMLAPLLARGPLVLRLDLIDAEGRFLRTPSAFLTMRATGTAR